MNASAKTLALGIGLLATSLLLHAQESWDAGAQFSPTNNPSDVWSYGYAGSFGGFIPFPMHDLRPPGVDTWLRDLGFPTGYPRVAKNNSGQTLKATADIWQVDQLGFHPGSSVADQYAIVRFTAPTTGVYTVTARFTGIETGPGTSTDVHVLVNGASFFDGRIQGFGSEVSFTSPLALTLRDGDSVDFTVGNGGNGFNGDTTGLAATVTLVRKGVEVSIYTAVELYWNTQSNKTYQVESSTTLLTNDWTRVGLPVPGDGAPKYLFDSTRGQPKKYYRVLTVE
jgi:hypothetical protein